MTSYDHSSGIPYTEDAAISSSLRNEFDSIKSGFDHLDDLISNPSNITEEAATFFTPTLTDGVNIALLTGKNGAYIKNEKIARVFINLTGSEINFGYNWKGLCSGDVLVDFSASGLSPRSSGVNGSVFIQSFTGSISPIFHVYSKIAAGATSFNIMYSDAAGMGNVLQYSDLKSVYFFMALSFIFECET